MTENKKARPWDLFNKNIIRVSSDIADERMSVCLGCEHFLKITGQCKECGCFMKAKTLLPHAECPIGHWKAQRVEIYE
jgi:hypothetical protein